MESITLPPSLDLPPHLSAYKYFVVCTLTVAAWDTLVLSPRTWRLLRSPGWPALKILFHFIRVFMPAEFIVVAVAFFDTTWSQSACDRFYPFEPICTAILLAAVSAIHVIRIQAIYNKNRIVLLGMTGLYTLQIVVTVICCGFYRSVPLLEGQGCIAGPRHAWVAIYWVAPTIFYTVTLALALARSISSLRDRPLSPWKLMLRDGLNLYLAIWFVNMVNVLFWLIMKPTGTDDPIKTIVTSMAAVLSTSMTMRIVLAVRGPLAGGGSFATSATSDPSTGASRTAHIISGRSTRRSRGTTFTLDDIRTKPESEWDMEVEDGMSSVAGDRDREEGKARPTDSISGKDDDGVASVIAMDKEVEYDGLPRM